MKPRSFLVILFVCFVWTWAGCGDDDVGGETGKEALAAKARSCGLLGPGLSPYDYAQSEEDRCYDECFLNASCADLEWWLCDSTGFTPPALEACWDACNALVFLCDDGQEISGSLECDLVSDCDDDSDEAYCDPAMMRFYCEDGSGWIDADFFCDGVDDCADGSDEPGCAETLCQ